MSKLVQFTDVHFPGLTQNSYDKLNNMKLDFNVSSVTTRPLALVYKLGRVITSFFQVFGAVFFKGNSPGYLQK